MNKKIEIQKREMAGADEDKRVNSKVFGVGHRGPTVLVVNL